MGFGDRLKEERERLGLTQTDFAEAGGCKKNTQLDYEKDRRSPDVAYLSGISGLGADVIYLVTGERDQALLNKDERHLLSLFRQAGPEGKGAAIGALEGGLKAIGGAL